LTAAYTLKPTTEITTAEKAGLDEMKEAVYPPHEFADSPGRRRDWLRPAWCVLVTVDDMVASYTGIVLTSGDVDGRATTIGGVGGIATHPEQRGRGHARESVDIAIEWMKGQEAEFALLVCRDKLVRYYSDLGWALFRGDLLVTQFGEPEVFTFNRVMVRAVGGEPPTGGTIDLHGPPW